MAQKLNNFHSNLFAVLAKERELQKDGYQQGNTQDADQLKRGEYFVQAPHPERTTPLQGWEDLIIYWRTFS